MQTDALWDALEADAGAGKASVAGWLLRLAQPAASCPLFVAVELNTGRRAILLRLSASAAPPRREWPRCKGLECFAVVLGKEGHFGVSLKDVRYQDVFSALAGDLIRRVSAVDTPQEQVVMFLGQLGRWQKFLSASIEGLSEESQRGLWGELHFFRQFVLPLGGATTVNGWKGPSKAHQDFQFEGGAIEVKTTLAKQPQVVRITNERQLDETGWKSLVLHVTSLDARENGGETLPQIIRDLRHQLNGNGTAQEHFEDLLIEAGYFDSHADRYSERGYIVRSLTTLLVERGFPRLVERDMPAGVGDTSYSLAVSACVKFSLKETDFKKILSQILSPPKPR